MKFFVHTACLSLKELDKKNICSHFVKSLNFAYEMEGREKYEKVTQHRRGESVKGLFLKAFFKFFLVFA